MVLENQVLLALLCVLFATGAMAVNVSNKCSSRGVTTKATLPKDLIVGYCNWHQSDGGIVDCVKNGVNVIIWFSIDLGKDGVSGNVKINRGPNMDEVAQVVKDIRDLELDCVHLMSIGGWNADHPVTDNVTPEDAYLALEQWNKEVAARPDLGFDGFDGFDWDIEGNDDFESKYNTMTVECVDLMGQLSQLLKQNGYIVAMAPAESYLDPTQSEYSLSLAHNHEEWKELQPTFNYRGRNSYAPLLSKYGKTTIVTRTGTEAIEEEVDTFDFVTIQLYEGYSHAMHKIRVEQQPAAEYISQLISAFENGWYVNYDTVPELGIPSQRVSVPHTKVVIGLANGWAGDDKFILLSDEELQQSYEKLKEMHMQPKGFAFWNMKDEGQKGVYMSIILNHIIKTREKK
jgi:hypothetical protein